jgi:membrane-bound metal-dependent hydrolase YbcI (DUF457 family)
MDLFTHVLVAYLVTYGIVGLQPQYLMAGALAGGLPDADVFLWPLGRRWAIYRHHGITHSLPGVTVVAVAGALLGPQLAPGSPWVYFLVMEAGGIAHVLQDGFTHFSVQPLLPFSKKRLQLDADRAINMLTMGVSIASFVLLLGVERNHVPLWVFQLTVYLLMAFFGGYFAVRGTARALIARAMKRFPDYVVPIPTANPLTWLLLVELKDGGRERTTFVRYRLGRGIVLGPLKVDVPLTDSETTGPEAPFPIETADQAMEASYALARKTSEIFDETYHFAEAQKDGRGGWLVTWYSLEFAAMGRAAAVRVRIDPEGKMTATRAWHTPLWRRELT